MLTPRIEPDHNCVMVLHYVFGRKRALVTSSDPKGPSCVWNAHKSTFPTCNELAIVLNIAIAVLLVGTLSSSVRQTCVVFFSNGPIQNTDWRRNSNSCGVTYLLDCFSPRSFRLVPVSQIWPSVSAMESAFSLTMWKSTLENVLFMFFFVIEEKEEEIILKAEEEIILFSNLIRIFGSWVGTGVHCFLERKHQRREEETQSNLLGSGRPWIFWKWRYSPGDCRWALLCFLRQPSHPWPMLWKGLLEIGRARQERSFHVGIVLSGFTASTQRVARCFWMTIVYSLLGRLLPLRFPKRRQCMKLKSCALSMISNVSQLHYFGPICTKLKTLSLIITRKLPIGCLPLNMLGMCAWWDRR